MTTATFHPHRVVTHRSIGRFDVPQPPSATCNVDTPAQRLRGAGLRVTSARTITLRLATAVVASGGQLTPKGLYETAQRLGYSFSLTTFHQVLHCLENARLLPAAPAFPLPRTSRRAPAIRTATDTDHAH